MYGLKDNPQLENGLVFLIDVCLGVLIIRSISSDKSKNGHRCVSFVIEIYVCRRPCKTVLKLLLPWLPGVLEDHFMYRKYILINTSIMFLCFK